MPVVPPKLRPGSSVRVIAPSRSLAIIPADVRAEADKKLAALGLQVSFGEHAGECGDFVSSSVGARLADLHAAFADPDVGGILTVIGGFNANQLLAGLDYPLIATHPKVLCGFSDITALSNAIYARTGLVGYSGPHYSSFGMKHHFGYTEAGFVACLMRDGPVELASAPAWSDDPWYLDQEDRHLATGTDWWVLQEGEAAGAIVGGNLCTLQTAMTRDLLAQIVAPKADLAGLPVIGNVDFGHTTPAVTFPIGGTVEVRADRSAPRLTITGH